MKSIYVAAALAAACGSASAQFVELTGSQNITETGQTFVFTFDGLLPAASEGTLVIEGLGDFSVVPPSLETLDWDIDGIASGQGFDASAFSGTVDLFQNAVSQSWTISLADMVAITSDGSLTITLVASSAVNFYADQPEDFLSVNLSYTAIPAPGAVAVLGAGGLLAARRRR